LYSTHKFKEKGAGVLDGKNWMPEFLRIVGEAEVKDGRRYLDGVDVHVYPYWAPKDLNAAGLFKATLEVGPNLDTLQVWMQQYLQGDRQVYLSEFSTTVVPRPYYRSVQATAMGEYFAHLWSFCDRFKCPWMCSVAFSRDRIYYEPFLWLRS
jgi:hypothetical protein